MLLNWGNIRILGTGLELACNAGSCGRISVKRELISFVFEIPPALDSVTSYTENTNIVQYSRTSIIRTRWD